MGAAEVISCEEVRARKQWSTLRQQLHECFDHWLDTLEQQWREPPSTLMEVTSTVRALRQQLTGGLTETIVAHVHRGEHDRQQVPCPKCDRVLQAREPVCRTVATMVGAIRLERPYFYCRACREGVYPICAYLTPLPQGTPTLLSCHFPLSIRVCAGSLFQPGAHGCFLMSPTPRPATQKAA
jgi:hypothetical protein